MTELIGALAALLTTIAFVPQALRAWQTRNLSAISLTMYLVFTTGVSLWLVYGLLLKSWPIILANAVTLPLAGTVLVLKILSLRSENLRKH